MPASKSVQKMINKSQSGKSLDGEVTRMRMGLVKQNRAVALCLLFTQALFPCPTSLIFFFHYDFTMVKLSFTFQNISKSFLGTLLQRTNNQSKKFWIQERCRVFLQYKESWILLQGCIPERMLKPEFWKCWSR